MLKSVDSFVTIKKSELVPAIRRWIDLPKDRKLEVIAGHRHYLCGIELKADPTPDDVGFVSFYLTKVVVLEHDRKHTFSLAKKQWNSEVVTVSI